MTSETAPPCLSIIEKHIGRKIREQRQLLKLTQQEVAASLGLTGQQIHKYEKGSDRISASRLFELAQILAVSLDFFYDGLEGAPPSYKEAEFQVVCANLKGKNIQIKCADLNLTVSEVKVLKSIA